jgi:hypothetical protein
LFFDLIASKDFPIPRDSVLQQYCLEDAGGLQGEDLARWSKQDFIYLWPSIKYLENFLKQIEPHGFIKLIYRDRRNSYAWWTFLWVSILFDIYGLTNLVETDLPLLFLC